jgi:hypothetical protein
MLKKIFTVRETPLAQAGRRLATQLETIAKDFHVKSDEFETVLWEADILRAKANNIDQQCAVIPNLRSSVLLSNCSRVLLSEHRELIEEINAFHVAYDEHTRSL